MSALSYAGLMCAPMVTVWPESPGTSSTVRVCVVASNMEFVAVGFFGMVGSSLLMLPTYFASSSAWSVSAAMMASAS